jgi:hypothetical protein
MTDTHAFDIELIGKEKEICLKLHSILAKFLTNSTSKLYHGSPVWFINGNPIAGYSIKKSGIALLFWSGQSFRSEGLKPVGKYKAAEIIFQNPEDIDCAHLENIFSEAINVQWNYRDIMKNKGKLELL